MKQKRYITPTVTVVTIESCRFLCASGVYLAEDTPQTPAIPYGGVDEEGEMVPGARVDRYMDDEDDDDE